MSFIKTLWCHVETNRLKLHHCCIWSVKKNNFQLLDHAKMLAVVSAEQTGLQRAGKTVRKNSFRQRASRVSFVGGSGARQDQRWRHNRLLGQFIVRRFQLGTERGLESWSGIVIFQLLLVTFQRRKSLQCNFLFSYLNFEQDRCEFFVFL